MTPAHPALDAAFARLAVPVGIRDMIATRHGEPHRHYHTLRHIDLMLRQIPPDHRFADEMIAATLFHDIVYDPTRSDNEERSLESFLSVADLIAPGLPLNHDLIARMIRATKGHRFHGDHGAEDAAIDVLLKADLSILWHPDPQVYAWYAEGVRREYGFVADGAFREARGQILTTLRDDLLASGQLSAAEADTLQRNVGWELA